MGVLGAGRGTAECRELWPSQMDVTIKIQHHLPAVKQTRISDVKTRARQHQND